MPVRAGVSTTFSEKVNTRTSAQMPRTSTAKAAAASSRVRSDLADSLASIEPETSTSTTVVPASLSIVPIDACIAWSIGDSHAGTARAAAT